MTMTRRVGAALAAVACSAGAAGAQTIVGGQFTAMADVEITGTILNSGGAVVGGFLPVVTTAVFEGATEVGLNPFPFAPGVIPSTTLLNGELTSFRYTQPDPVLLQSAVVGAATITLNDFTIEAGPGVIITDINGQRQTTLGTNTFAPSGSQAVITQSGVEALLCADGVVNFAGLPPQPLDLVGPADLDIVLDYELEADGGDVVQRATVDPDLVVDVPLGPDTLRLSLDLIGTDPVSGTAPLSVVSFPFGVAAALPDTTAASPRTGDAVTRAQVVFSSLPVLSSPTITVTNGGGAAVGFSALLISPNTLAIDFSTPLLDDVYTVTLGAGITSETGVLLDGDGDGFPGGDAIFQIHHSDSGAGGGCLAETTGDVPPMVDIFDLLNFLAVWFSATDGQPCP